MKTERGFSLGMMLIVLLFAVAAGSIGWVTLGIVAQDRWPIRWLEVNGSFQRVSAEQVRSRLAPLISSSYFTIDLARLALVAEDMAWVARVDVQKHWPETVSVKVYEYEPVAHWNSGQLISKNGVAFEVNGADQMQGLPWLQAPEDRLDEVLDHWVRFNDALMPIGLDIQRLALDQRGAWALTLSNGTQVQLGRDHAEDRIDRLVGSWSGLMLDRQDIPQVIDLRYTNGFAVNWPQAESTRNDS